jgi:ATP-dependent Clp protease ATP-binding subunit ClpB
VEALKREKDAPSVERLTVLEDTINGEEAKLKTLTDEWTADRERRERINQLKERIDSTRYELEVAVRGGEYERAAKLKHVTLPELIKQSKELLSAAAASPSLLPEVVGPDEVTSLLTQSNHAHLS